MATKTYLKPTYLLTHVTLETVVTVVTVVTVFTVGDKTQTQIVTKIRNTNCDKTQKHKL